MILLMTIQFERSYELNIYQFFFSRLRYKGVIQYGFLTDVSWLLIIQQQKKPALFLKLHTHQMPIHSKERNKSDGRNI